MKCPMCLKKVKIATKHYIAGTKKWSCMYEVPINVLHVRLKNAKEALRKEGS